MKYIIIQFKEILGNWTHTTGKIIVLEDGTIKHFPELRFKWNIPKKKLSEKIIKEFRDTPLITSTFFEYLDLIKLKKLWKKEEIENLLLQNFDGIELIYYREF